MALVNDTTIERRVKARAIARDALKLGLEEIAAMSKNEDTNLGAASYEAFWDEVQATLGKVRPLNTAGNCKPKEQRHQPRESLAQNQREGIWRDVESVLGGVIVNETQLAWKLLFDADGAGQQLECWLPKSAVCVAPVDTSSYFDYVVLPEEMAIAKGIPTVDPDD